MKKLKSKRVGLKCDLLRNRGLFTLTQDFNNREQILDCFPVFFNVQ